jgi:hypothetical protein
MSRSVSLEKMRSRAAALLLILLPASPVWAAEAGVAPEAAVAQQAAAQQAAAQQAAAMPIGEADAARALGQRDATVAGEAPANAAADASAGPTEVSATTTLAQLQERYNRILHDGVRGLRSSEAPGAEVIIGDNTDPWGMTWTKCTNLGIDLVSTLVAEQRGLVDEVEARRQIRGIVDILARVQAHRGIFPENIVIRGGIAGEVVEGRMRFSSIDSAWVTVALSLVEARYKPVGDPLAEDAAKMIAKQDYRAFVGKDGMLGAGFFVDVKTDKKVETIPFSYSDRNSEARPLLLALVGMGQLPASAWDRTQYVWGQKEGLTLAKGWHFSAFVEMTGALFFDESRLAPRSLGKSHENYIEASLRVAQRNGHQMFGYAPACDALNSYAEFGLDRPDSVSPYAAALLTMTGDVRALQNMDEVLSSLPQDGRALPDGLDPRTGEVSCGVARILDQGLLFLALNADVVRGLVQKTPWYPSAERRLRAMDRKNTAPIKKQRPSVGEPESFLQPDSRDGGMLALASLSEIRAN